MPSLPTVILTLLGEFANIFTRSTWKYAQTLWIGSILTNGKRTVTSAMRVMGLTWYKRFERYHQVLYRAKWNQLNAGKILLGLLISLLPTGIPILIAMDDTIERRSGRKIKAIGCYRDAPRSSKKMVVNCFGLKWLCAALIIKLPWSKRCWALPFLTVLCPSKKDHEKKGRAHKTSLDRAVVMIQLISKWLNKEWTLVGDGAFACFKLAHACVKNKVTLISRLRLDASLFELLPDNLLITKGRKPKKGKKIITLKQQIKDNMIQWQEQQVTWYGRQLKLVKFASGINLWHKSAEEPVKIRWVIVMHPDTGKIEAFFSTNISRSPKAIIENFVLRWSIEVTFEEVRAHLGVETQRQWSDNSIKRTTPILLANFSLVCIIAQSYNKLTASIIPTICASWYDKHGNVTFSDVLVYVKKLILTKSYLSNSAINDEFVQLRRQELEALINNTLMAS